MYHLAIHGSGGSLHHATSLDVGWTYSRMTPGVCCSTSASHATVQSTPSHVRLLQIVTVRVAVRSGLTRGTLSASLHREIVTHYM